MADAVSKLYAEIGFKVNQEGLKEAKKLLAEFAAQMSAINKMSKSQAENFGIFSNQRTQKDIQRERIFKRLIKSKKNSLSWLERQENKIAKDSEKREAEKLRAQEKAAKEQAKIDRQREQDTKKHNERMIKFATRGVRGMVRVLRGSAKLFANATRTMWKGMVLPNLAGAVNVRDFMMYSGTSLSKLQDIEERFASVGSSVSRDDMMNELSNAMENLTKIRFAKGELGGYKLSGLQALAFKKDASGILDALEKASVGVSNQDLSFLLDEIGLSGRKWLPYFRARQRVNKALPRIDEGGQQSLVDAQSSLQYLLLGLRRSGEIMTSKLAPVIDRVSNKFIDFISTAISDDNVKKIEGVIERLSDRFIKWLETIDAQDIEAAVTRFFGAVRSIAEGIEWLANKINTARGVKSAYDAAKRGDKKEFLFNAVEAFASHIGASPAVTIYNNQQTNVNVENPKNDEYERLIEKAVEEGVSKGTEKGNYAGTFIMAGQAR